MDVGCGNGAFLRALCGVWPECRALGVDPALPRDEVLADGRLTLIKGVFERHQLEGPPSLIVSRHVLEHMPDPVAFVGELRAASDAGSGAPVFVEVPDLDCILEHRAVWDFCSEHCNYFTPATLRELLNTVEHFTRERTQLVSTRDRLPQELPGLGPELAARLMGGLGVDVATRDVATRSGERVP